jgi:hypothetical protein
MERDYDVTRFIKKFFVTNILIPFAQASDHQLGVSGHLKANQLP